MKNTLLLHIGIFFILSGTMAQGTVVSAGAPNRMVEALNKDWKLTVVSSGAQIEEGNTFSGSMFYNADWDKGYIKLADNKEAGDLSLRFNAYTNQIYMRRDSDVLVVDGAESPVSEFGLEEGGSMKIFRRGYPATGSNTTRTFYEVVASGKFCLLELHAKRLVESSDVNHVRVKELVDAVFWYVFNSTDGSIKEIRHNKNGLLEALPGQADALKAIIQEKKLRMKDDEDWVILFSELNRR
ncbi:MAG TPA: hypothetical protein VIM64_07420 [Puia sp.]